MNLSISEKFYSIQGEGRTTGIPAFFLRLSGCNILCQSESWICDTIEVWKKGVKTEFEDVFTDEDIVRFRNGVHLVITGGEPLLHQKKIIEFLNWFKNKFEFIPCVEIETNGTILPDAALRVYVKYFNVSPKLSNSGEKLERRFKPEVISKFNDLEQTIFKFVIEKESDYQELYEHYFELIHKYKVYLMPAGENQEALAKTRPIVAEICKKSTLKFTDRLHISVWDKKTGV
jgi:organic radical activating enzyme